MHRLLLGVLALGCDDLEAAFRRHTRALDVDSAAPGMRTIALDGKGTALSSEAFAMYLAGWQDGGIADVIFAIGGANGLHPDLSRAAELTLSLSAMTWPHLLARAMLAEQLYRAHTILTGHPYHRA